MSYIRDLKNKNDHFVFEGLKAFMNELISRGGSVVGMYAHLPNQRPQYLGHEGVKDVLKESELILSALPPPPRIGNIGQKLPRLEVNWKRKGHNFFRPCIKTCRDIIVGKEGSRYKGQPTPAYWPTSIPYREPSRRLTVEQCIKVIKHMYSWAKENNFLEEGYDPDFSDDNLSEPDEPEPEHQQEIGGADVAEGGADVAEESADEEDWEGFENEEEEEEIADVAEGCADEEDGEGFETEEEEEIAYEHEEEFDSVSPPQVEHGNDNECEDQEDEEPQMSNVSGSRAPGNVIRSDTDDDTVPEEHQVAGPSRERPRRSKRQKTLRE